MKITVIAYRAGETFGDVMGAYRTIQALCKDLLTRVTINLRIIVESNSTKGLINLDGSSILTTPNEKIDFNVHLFDMGKMHLEVAQSLGRTSVPENDVDYYEETIDRVCHRMILSILSKNAFMNSDLMIFYNNPDIVLTMLKVCAEHRDLKSARKTWFISEYNGGDYREIVQKIRDYPAPENLQIKIIMTGFPDETLSEPVIGVFVDRQEIPKLTKYENDFLKNLGYESTQSEYISGLFFGYTNYSLNKDVHNRNINLELFAKMAIKQYMVFTDSVKKVGVEISIIAPFNRKECETLAEEMRSERPNVSIQMIYLMEDKSLRTEQISTVETDNKIVVRLINVFPLTPALFNLFLEKSERLTIQTGDQSFIESILNKKVPLCYQIMYWKLDFYLRFADFLLSLSNEQSSSTLSESNRKLMLEFKSILLSIVNRNPDEVGMDRTGINELCAQKLIEIAVRRESFDCMIELFHRVSNKLTTELNAGNNLRIIMKTAFPELEFQSSAEEKQEIELKYVSEKNISVSPSIENKWTPLYGIKSSAFSSQPPPLSTILNPVRGTSASAVAVERCSYPLT